MPSDSFDEDATPFWRNKTVLIIAAAVVTGCLLIGGGVVLYKKNMFSCGTSSAILVCDEFKKTSLEGLKKKHETAATILDEIKKLSPDSYASFEHQKRIIFTNASLFDVTDAVIVNPTNETGKPRTAGGFVDPKLHAASTVDSVDLMMKYIKDNYKSWKGMHDKVEEEQYIVPGGCLITPSFGTVKAGAIINVVGPAYVDGEAAEVVQKKDEQLRETYRNVLKLASKNGINVIAVPAISAGKNKASAEKHPEIVLPVIAEFLKSHESIHVVLILHAPDAVTGAYKTWMNKPLLK